MTNVLAGLIALTLSFLINKYIFAKVNCRGVIIFISPFIEEILKTGLAYYLVNGLIITHLVFGLGEASFDLFNNNNIAASLALLTHLLFGIFTFWLWKWSNSLIAAIILVVLVHIIWNYLIISYKIIHKEV